MKTVPLLLALLLLAGCAPTPAAQPTSPPAPQTKTGTPAAAAPDQADLAKGACELPRDRSGVFADVVWRPGGATGAGRMQPGWTIPVPFPSQTNAYSFNILFPQGFNANHLKVSVESNGWRFLQGSVNLYASGPWQIYQISVEPTVADQPVSSPIKITAEGAQDPNGKALPLTFHLRPYDPTQPAPACVVPSPFSTDTPPGVK